MSKPELLTKLKVALEKKEKILCEQSLAQFTRSAWHIIEPGTELVWNWHLDTICGYLMTFHNNELPDKRLIINIPPGTLKSILVSVMYPAWCWISNPSERFLTVTNEQGLAIRDALRMKQIITSDWFQDKWPLALQADQNEKTLYANEKRGFRQAQGIGASNTGKRGSCFPAYTQALSEHGLKNITEISVGDLVWSMDVDTGIKSLKPVTHTVHNKNCEIIELVLSNGGVIHCTHDHKFWTVNNDFIEAKDLVASGFFHLPLNVISMVFVNIKHLSKLFASEGGVHDKSFILFGNLRLGKHSVLSPKGSNHSYMTPEKIGQFFGGFATIKNNIFISLRNFYNSFASDSSFTPSCVNTANINADNFSSLFSAYVGIKNYFNFILSEFSFKCPRIFSSFINGMFFPKLAYFDGSNCSAAHSITGSNSCIMSSVNTNAFSYFWGNLCAWSVDSNRESSVSFGISNIFASCSPRQIFRNVIKRVSVKMPDFMLLGRLVSMKGGTYRLMNVNSKVISFVVASCDKIAMSIIVKLKDFSFTQIGDVTIRYRSIFASDKSGIANRVSSVIAFNGNPYFIVSSRIVGHIDDTYCLTVKDNHTMYVHDGKESILSHNCMILDDPIDAKKAFSDVIRQSVNDTWDNSLSSRLNDLEKSGVLVIMQRVHEIDLAGHLLKKVKSQWTVLSIPMRYEGRPSFDAGKDIGKPGLNDPRTKKGELLFPKKFTERAVQSIEEDLGEYGTAAQYQQRPSPAGGGILKKHWWRVWPDDMPLPVCNHIFLSLDTAFTEKDSKTSAYSAMTRWGIFWHEQRDRYCIIALGMWFERCGYEELRTKIKEMNKKFNPDAILIEKKATGISLLQDLRKAVPGKLRSYIPREDKISRAHSVSPMLQSGQVYAPNKNWAVGDESKKITGLIEYAGSFPNGAPPSADLTDTITQALIYLRAGNWAGDHDDDKDIILTKKDHLETEEFLEDAQDARTEIRIYG